MSRRRPLRDAFAYWLIGRAEQILTPEAHAWWASVMYGGALRPELPPNYERRRA